MRCRLERFRTRGRTDYLGGVPAMARVETAVVGLVGEGTCVVATRLAMRAIFLRRAV